VQFRLSELIAHDLHNLVYLEEFVFPASKFIPAGGTEVELADAVVALDDTLLVFQVKERDVSAVGDEKLERAWFQKRVIKDATRQIRKTLAHLASSELILIGNSRGRQFDLASSRFSSVIKIVVYRAAPHLPADCRAIRFHRSKTAGFIHIVEYHDYVRLSEFLRVPEEIRLYFAYREKVLSDDEKRCESLHEACLVGGFIGEDEIPSEESVRHLHRAIDDEETWNLVPLLRGLHDHYSKDGYSDDYYQILSGFMRLPRSMWREVKKRFQLAVEKVTADKFTLPYRVSDPARDIGVVIVPADSEFSGRQDWHDLKVRMLITMTELHKFDQKLGKCIGILVAKHGVMFDIQWCMIIRPWEDHPELRARLDQDSPFREAIEKTVFGFYTVGD
jgi:hypothetical protein